MGYIGRLNENAIALTDQLLFYTKRRKQFNCMSCMTNLSNLHEPLHLLVNCLNNLLLLRLVELRLHLWAGVEQPFDCLIVKNH